MGECSERVELRKDYWQIAGPIFGDLNPPHYGRFADYCSYPKPSSPAVYLLTLAERSLIKDNKLSFPMRVETNLHFPAFEGEYELRKNYSQGNSRLSFWVDGGPVADFKFKSISSRGSSCCEKGLESLVDSDDLRRINALLSVSKNNQVYFSFAFGKVINAFFRDRTRLGAVLGSMKFEVYQAPEIGGFSTVLDVQGDMKSENDRKKALDYSVKGSVYQKGEVLRVLESMFHQRMSKIK